MGLEIVTYDGESYSSPFSTAGSQTNPIVTVHDGRVEITKDMLLYAKNEDATPTLTYTNVKVDFVDYAAPNDVEGIETGWYIKVSAGITQPTEAEWAIITAGAQVDIPDVDGGNPAQPFWLRIHSPRGLSVGYKVDLALELKYTENAP